MPAARARTGDDLDLPPAPPAFDTWTGLLVISCVATLLGLIFVWMDSRQYNAELPDLQSIRAPARPTPEAGAPAAGGMPQPAGAPGAQPKTR